MFLETAPKHWGFNYRVEAVWGEIGWFLFVRPHKPKYCRRLAQLSWFPSSYLAAPLNRSWKVWEGRRFRTGFGKNGANGKSGQTCDCVMLSWQEILRDTVVILTGKWRQLYKAVVLAFGEVRRAASKLKLMKCVTVVFIKTKWFKSRLCDTKAFMRLKYNLWSGDHMWPIQFYNAACWTLRYDISHGM